MTCTQAGTADADPGSMAVLTRILVADDDVDCRELVSRALGGPSTEIWTAADGGELLDLTSDDRALDLIVTDIDMPWMQGLQVLASIREAGLTTPVLVITGLTRPDLPRSVERMGHAKLLYKPFDIEQLRSAVAELLSNEARR